MDVIYMAAWLNAKDHEDKDESRAAVSTPMCIVGEAHARDRNTHDRCLDEACAEDIS